jgi:predicted DsbA family dithiol-disulfide isomerase
MIVEVWSDVVCPWCYIGKRRFATALTRVASTRPEVEVEAEVDVRYRAFLLDPGAPVGVSQPVRDVYEKKFGGPEAAQAILDRVTAEAAGEGLLFRLDIAQRSNTLAAHRLLVLAEQLGVQADLKERLLAAYFTEGRAIGEVETLVELAVEAGIDAGDARRWIESGQGRDEVASQLEFAADHGITGVPTYVFDREVAISGAQPPELFAKVVERRLAAVS